MLYIKPVDAESSTWEFEVSDHTLVALAALLLDDESDESAASLAETLSRDPAFIIWAAIIIARQGATFRTIRELAGHVFLPRLFSSEVSHLAGETQKDIELTETSLRAMIRAEVARFLLTSEAPSSCDDPVYLGAILASGPEILGCEASEIDLPVLDLTESEQRAVDEAGQMIGKRQLPKKIDNLDERLLGIDALLGAGWIEKRRRRLRQRIPLAHTLLEKLIARLERVRRIEEEFQKTLEHEKLEAMAEFAAGAGHEINNPIAVIAGRAQLMLQDETDPERSRSLALINAQAKRVYEMIADMRLFARPPEPTFERVDLVSLIDELFDELAETAERHAMTLRQTGVRRAVEIEADPTQLTILLRVMIQNSMEAIGSGGTIEIEVDEGKQGSRGSEKGGRNLLPAGETGDSCSTGQKEPVSFFTPGVTIRVSDDGPGITDEVRRHLFDPYYSGRQAGRGLGLGLSKAWRIVVTNHGGTIDVDSQPGHGATFTVHLPKHRYRSG